MSNQIKICPKVQKCYRIAPEKKHVLKILLFVGSTFVEKPGSSTEEWLQSQHCKQTESGWKGAKKKRGMTKHKMTCIIVHESAVLLIRENGSQQCHKFVQINLTHKNIHLMKFHKKGQSTTFVLIKYFKIWQFLFSSTYPSPNK